MGTVKDDESATAAPLPRPAAFGAPTMAASGAAIAPPTLLAPTLTPALNPNPAVDPAHVLDDLVNRVDGVHAALLASVDGFEIARSAAMPDEPAHAAMLAAAVGLAHQLAAMGDGATLRQLVVEHDRGLVVVSPTGNKRVLAVLAATTVDQRTLRTAVRDRATLLAGGAT